LSQRLAGLFESGLFFDTVLFMTDLVERRCRPCEGGVDPLTAAQAEELIQALHPDWRLDDSGRSIRRTFEFPGYARTIAFANAVAWIATSEGHHPVMTVRYGTCEVTYATHAIDGLSDNDFICAAKIDRLAAE
jgi:4a-hydroxytetrahydrobiopterin dehydratase